MTLKPANAKENTSGKPTYPSPTIHIFKFLFEIFDKRFFLYSVIATYIL